MANSGKIQIQFLSDIHLEINVDNSYSETPSEEKQAEILKNLQDNKRTPIFAAKAPFLALLGDIGYPWTWVIKHFLLEQVKRFQKVFYICGNHEYYSTTKKKLTMDEITATFQDLRNLHENIVILDKSKHEYENFVFIGTTLWTEYPCNSNDTVKIYVSQNKTLTHDVYLNRFKVEYEYIREQVKKAEEEGKIAIVFTHHPPPHEKSSFLKTHNNVPLWLYGHTHYSTETEENTTLILSNQWGYPQLGEKPWDTGFFSEVVVEVDAQTRRAEIILRSNENDDLIREKELKEELEMKEKLRQRQLQQQSKPRGGPAPKKVEEKK